MYPVPTHGQHCQSIPLPINSSDNLFPILTFLTFSVSWTFSVILRSSLNQQTLSSHNFKTNQWLDLKQLMHFLYKFSNSSVRFLLFQNWVKYSSIYWDLTYTYVCMTVFDKLKETSLVNLQCFCLFVPFGSEGIDVLFPSVSPLAQTLPCAVRVAWGKDLC